MHHTPLQDNNSTSTDAAKKWLAAYLYYAEPWEKFLSEAVHPFVTDVLKDKWADHYFFIRYWEKGPHIRLRFWGDENKLTRELQPRLTDHFNSYFDKNPSARIDPEWLKDAPEEHQWFPNNSIQFIEYEPEVERYGGEHAIAIAEQQFETSSTAIFSIIKDSNDWSYDRALGAAIQLHLGFAHATGMPLEETKEFYAYIFAGWFPRAYNHYGLQDNQEGLKKQQEETLKAFNENFEKQKDTLVNYHELLWEAFESTEEFEMEWLNQWLIDMKDIAEKLQQLDKKSQLVFPKEFKPNLSLKTPANHQYYWSIYNSYIHMTNNRLGILNRDEGYLGYLIKESLKAFPD